MAQKILEVEYIKEDRGYRVEGKISKCWIWQGSLFHDGYGQCKRYTHLGEQRAHRYMYKKHGGVIPKGTELDHLCSIKACCRPTHVEPVTRLFHVKRTYARNPHANKHKRKLTAAQVLEIISLAKKGCAQKALGIRFGVAQSQIGNILRGLTYKYLTREA
jgi:HNH endonuclease